jgi:hypothetical protein
MWFRMVHCMFAPSVQDERWERINTMLDSGGFGGRRVGKQQQLGEQPYLGMLWDSSSDADGGTGRAHTLTRGGRQKGDSNGSFTRPGAPSNPSPEGSILVRGTGGGGGTTGNVSFVMNDGSVPPPTLSGGRINAPIGGKKRYSVRQKYVLLHSCLMPSL